MMSCRPGFRLASVAIPRHDARQIGPVIPPERTPDRSAYVKRGLLVMTLAWLAGSRVRADDLTRCSLTILDTTNWMAMTIAREGVLQELVIMSVPAAQKDE